VLDVVKALAALDPAGFGLDHACAQLHGSNYVMAEELGASFRIDRSGATGISWSSRRCRRAPSPQSHRTRSAAAAALRATLQLPSNNLIDRAS
jgi:hypothetical protein